jgi:hypothetical protein
MVRVAEAWSIIRPRVKYGHAHAKYGHACDVRFHLKTRRSVTTVSRRLADLPSDVAGQFQVAFGVHLRDVE